MTHPSDYFEILSRKASPWLSREGPFSHTVLSSRIRLARNLAGHRFCSRARKEELESITREVISAAQSASSLQESVVIDMENTHPMDRILMLERHLISQEFAKNGPGRSMIIDKDEQSGIMINEEDHLRLQTIEPGLSLNEAWKRIDQIDNELDHQLAFAFSPEWGYLTACPTNVGTGMRASVMLHLPALSMTGGIQPIIQKVGQSGLVVRGLYGENSEAVGDLYQFSNQITLGQNEEELITLVENYVKQIIGREQSCRKQLLQENRARAEDVVYRAYGILTNARMITSREAMDHLSHIRLGVSYGWLDIPYTKVDELCLLLKPAHLQKTVGQEMDPNQRDILRADFIRMKLSLPRG